ncbi:MAG: DEAD/DEAH box helicase family protein [Hyphomicrobiaceae bacterium]
MQRKEAAARIRINRLLEDAGWRLVDGEAGRANVEVEADVDITKAGDDFEEVAKGFVDYLLLDDHGFPVCVLEAKREKIHPLAGKEQARDYAKGKNARFVVLSNGLSHYLWDTDGGNPELITELPTQESLQHRSTYKPNVDDLISEKVSADYLSNKFSLRDYQVAAIHSIQQAAKEGKTRYLFEMATGTGKTSTAAAVCKLFLKTGNAKRILFLVDRIELEDQAVKAFKGIYGEDYFVDTIKSGQWQHCQVVVSTVQTLLAGDRYRDLFSQIDFELVISDEAHRSLGGNSRAVFEYFIGYKLGLTATPRDFLKGVDAKELAQDNPKALELRHLRDTYKTFGCEDGKPTFKYDLKAGVGGGYLVNPYVIDARTEVTTELLSEQGFTVGFTDEDGTEGEQVFGAKHFERTFFNEDTNRVFCEAILSNGKLDPLTSEFGKTLVFCVSQNHAAKVANKLNQLAMAKWPGTYASDFAMQVTSNVADSQQKTKDFSANRLGGKSQFARDTHPDYGTSKTRVCVTVGMMTTGYDCPDLLNVVLMRPVFSPADFVQMKGRGTRIHEFHYQETGEKARKDDFLLLDFFGTCEYFEKDFDYDQKLKLPAIAGKQGPDKPDPPVPPTPPKPDGAYEGDIDDAIKSEITIQIGAEGMRIDRDLYPKPHQQFEYVVQHSEEIKRVQETDGIEAVEEFVKAEVLNKPSEYWTAEKIRQSYEREHKVDRRLSFSEMILKALGLSNRFKTRDERLEEEYEKFIDIERPELASAEAIRTSKAFFETYLSDPDFREIIQTQQFARLATYPSINMNDLKALGPATIAATRQYADEYLMREMREFEWANQ